MSSKKTLTLRELRWKRGLSADTLAAILKVSFSTVYAVEAGKVSPSHSLRARWASALECPVDLFPKPKRRALDPVRAKARELAARLLHPPKRIERMMRGEKIRSPYDYACRIALEELGIDLAPRKLIS